LSRNPELRGCTRRSGYPAMSLGERRFDHFHFAICQRRTLWVCGGRVYV
jgi:hypothetical protein